MGLAGPKLQPVRCSIRREAASHINTSSTCASLNGSVNIAASPPAYLFARKPDSRTDTVKRTAGPQCRQAGGDVGPEVHIQTGVT